MWLLVEGIGLETVEQECVYARQKTLPNRVYPGIALITQAEACIATQYSRESRFCHDGQPMMNGTPEATPPIAPVVVCSSLSWLL
jgi:hypothetical protein